MHNFKLIAITPLKKCRGKYRKNLKKAQVYQFYNDYTITTNASGRAVSVERPDQKDKVPDALYHLENGIKLSISAVVGKNGTGKSSLFELLFYFIYAVYSRKEYNGRRILNTELEDITAEHEYASENYINLRDRLAAADKEQDEISRLEKYVDILPFAINLMKHYKIDMDPEKFISPESIAKGVRNKLHDNKLVRLFAQRQQQAKEDKKLSEGLAVAVLYEADDVIREIIYDRGEFEYNDFTPQRNPVAGHIADFNVDHFFYTICINYSHHGLNSRSIGGWINKLFHKNDAYFTPVVINPMRTEGKFDTNKEMALSKERLMANLLYDIVNNPDSKLLEKYEVIELLFTPKISKPSITMPFKVNPIESLTASKDILNAEGIFEMLGKNEYWDFALTYLEEKITRISDRYHFVIYDGERSEADSTAQLNKFLRKKKSHITKKIWQTINFLKLTYAPENRGFWKMGDKVTTATLAPSQIKEWMRLSNNELESLTPSQLVEIGPPGFFSFDLSLRAPDGRIVKYSDLSSGEQQMIHNRNAILYHLYNINSIQQESEEKGASNKRIIYRNVNIILDEIELYYHPEMQRRLITDLVRSFERIKKNGEKGIEAINLTLLTHSPFILSDIPDQNILSLTYDGPEKLSGDRAKTFGGNIHEILIDRFFMDATIGEHSINTIEELIRLYTFAQQADTPDQRQLLKDAYSDIKEKYEFVLKNVGEDVIREVLTNNLEYIKFVMSL